MNKFLATMKSGMADFARDEEGAQVVEYALIIAVVSIGLVVLIQNSNLLGTGFTGWVTRVITCLTGTAACA
jgi:pilus assembly protein Flp/PilA